MRKTLLKLIVVISVLLVSCGAKVDVKPSHDWPMSGVSPQGNRVIASPQEEKAPKSNVLAWKYTSTGGYRTSPAVAGGKLYIGTADYRILCLDANNGQLVWQSKLKSWALDTPCVASGVVCQLTDDDHVYCFDALSGKQKWDLSLKGLDYQGTTIDGKKLYVPAGKNLYCIDVENGTIIWKALFETENFDLVSTDSVRVYCSNSNDLVCLDASNGNILWTNSKGSYSSPVIYRGDVYVCMVESDANKNIDFGKRKKSFLCLNPKTGNTYWSIDIENIGNDIVLYDKYACISTYGSNKYICIDIDEKKVIWTHVNKDSGCPTPYVYNGKFCLGDGEGTSIIVPATGDIEKT